MTAGAAAVPVPVFAAEAAVRWRINAALLDNVIVYGGYLLICLVLHWRVANAGHALVLACGGVLYHWALEARDGQTIGKRQYGIRVMSSDGGRASAASIAFRSVLRIIDQLPLFYFSGLLNMVRTGPARRQRIGDVVGRTVVVAVDGRAKEKGTAGWVLPTSTILAALISGVFVISLLHAGKGPLTDTQRAEFIAGCERTSGGTLSCGCALNLLVERGYGSVNSLQSLFEQERAALATGNRAGIPRAVVDAAISCRR